MSDLLAENKPSRLVEPPFRPKQGEKTAFSNYGVHTWNKLPKCIPTAHTFLGFGSKKVVHPESFSYFYFFDWMHTFHLNNFNLYNVL